MTLQKCILGSVSTNCYFGKNNESGEMFIVDPADYADRIIAKVSEMQGKPVAVLLTHGHFDHILAANEICRYYRIPIYAHHLEQDMLLDPSVNMSAYSFEQCSIKVDKPLEDLQMIEVAGFSIQVLHTPGHTKGSCCYYLEDESILLSGDTLFYGSVGRTDFPGGSSEEIRMSLHRLVDNLPEDTVVYPGHDITTTIGYEKRYNPFV
ncbi:MAG: MBL fold metallo-hydrolase [Blautia sp.]|nr:MBL fold metallo-hydrolase [Blautia sp.]